MLIKLTKPSLDFLKLILPSNYYLKLQLTILTKLISNTDLIPDYLLPNLPTDITFEICTLPSRRESSSPGVINDTVITTTTSTAMVIDDSGNGNGECAGAGNCDNEDIDDEELEGGDSRGIESLTNSNYIKTERMVSGIHFLTTDHEDDERNQDLLVPKSETPSDTEPEVRKQVGFSCTRLKRIKLKYCRI